MIVVGVILVAAAAAVGLMARAGRPALDEKTVARVTPGMSAGEVEAVLGPATEVRRGTAAVTGAAGDPASRPETERRVWERDGKVVTVTFTGGRVAEVEMK
jgi:hypothetical protein